MQPTLNDGTVLDPKVLKVVKAIKTVESNGDYNAIGDGGSSAGAFQWNNNKKPLKPGEIPARFFDHAREAGLNDVKDFTPASQNKVAYNIIKKWKDQDGLDPEQIAAKWNGASKDPSTGRLVYNKPEYGVKFRNALKGSQPGGTYNPPPESKPFEAPANTGLENLQGDLGMKKDGLVGQVGQNIKDIGTGITKAVEDTSSGAIHPASGVLQGFGAVAGGVGAVTDTALRNLPLGFGGAYQFANDKVIAPAVGAVGEATGATAAFNKLSPEAQGNIGATANIASLFPFLKAFSTGKKGLMDSVTKLREPSIKKEAVGELESKLGSSQRASNLVEDGAIKRLVEKDALPDVVETAKDTFTYNVDDALEKINKEMKDVIKRQNEALKSQPETFTKQQLGSYKRSGDNIDITTPMQTALEKLNKHYDDLLDKDGRLWASEMKKKLDSDTVTLEDLKETARRISPISDAYNSSLELSAKKQGRLWENIRRDLNDVARERDATGKLKPLDKSLSQLEKEKVALRALKGKTVKGKKEGFVKGLLREIPGSRFVMPKTPSTATSKLKRRRPLQQTAQKGAQQLGVGMALSNQQGRENKQ